MTRIFYESDADSEALADQRVAVVGYGNQGRSWALNLRDSGIDPVVCARADDSRERAVADGFVARELAAASDADVVCLLVPDEAIPTLPIKRRDDSLTLVASGYTLAFDRFDPPGDVGMVAPRMLGPEVRRCYEEEIGFISIVGIHRDATGRSLKRTLAVARAIGGLRQGAIEMTPKQEAVLDLAVEQVLTPALTHVNRTFVAAMLEQRIPMEAILTELFLSGEVERNYRLLREIGYARQLDLHSPTSQYGQLSRLGSYDHLDFASRMRERIDEIVSGRFADEWDLESEGGHRELAELKTRHAGPMIRAFEEALRTRLGPAAKPS
jgi:ketol-acid reductoisomerase